MHARFSVVFEGGKWRVLQDAARVGSFSRQSLAETRARQLARIYVRRGFAIAITLYNRSGGVRSTRSFGKAKA